MSRQRRFTVGALLCTAAVLAFMGVGYAQRGGRSSAPRVSGSSARMDALGVDFQLTKDQKKTVKEILDAAHENAAPIRDGLTKAHAAIEAAIHGDSGEAEIDAAVQAYAEQATAMTALEIKALADVMKALTDEQRANNAAISRAFFLLRGAFLDPKKWDDIPTGRLY